MRYIGIIPNLDKDSELVTTAEISEFLKQKGCGILILEEKVRGTQLEGFGAPIELILDRCSFIVVLGGDGTMLSVAGHSARKNVPILGINLGHIGFLTAVGREEAREAIEQVLSGDYKLEKRMMLEASYRSYDNSAEGILALNDVCITRGMSSKLVKINVYINDEFMDTFRADGIIISTPTGSTAYNLSAGGPILKPDSEIIAITPICPHTLYTRSTAISSSDRISLEMHMGNPKNDVLLSADGQYSMPLSCDNVVRIERSEYYTTIIKTKQEGFYDILRDKLLRNGG